MKISFMWKKTQNKTKKAAYISNSEQVLPSPQGSSCNSFFIVKCDCSTSGLSAFASSDKHCFGLNNVRKLAIML